ncbi:hypothetical protein V8G54_020659 [Vigna mungo]|uniref:Uncharacterized protein n=1 Tax=Vigna mungo TaxID=3915 RepID=A0AAQ3NFY8_VIGMU
MEKHQKFVRAMALTNKANKSSIKTPTKASAPSASKAPLVNAALKIHDLVEDDKPVVTVVVKSKGKRKLPQGNFKFLRTFCTLEFVIAYPMGITFVIALYSLFVAFNSLSYVCIRIPR